jgi:hypothetical protein
MLDEPTAMPAPPYLGWGLAAHCVVAAQSLHPPAAVNRDRPQGLTMRAEIQNVVAEIKQSVGLLRRHL